MTDEKAQEEQPIPSAAQPSQPTAQPSATITITRRHIVTKKPQVGNRSLLKKANQGEIPALTYEEALSHLERIGKATQEPARNKALLAALFLTGCRIEELVRWYPGKAMLAKLKDNPFFKDQLHQLGYLPSIIKSQVEILPDGFELHRIRTLKRRDYITRQIPVINANEKEQPFINAFLAHINSLQGDQEAFPITRERAWQLITTHTGTFCHAYRHARATILTSGRYYDLNESQVQAYFGWHDPRSAKPYTHLTTEDLKAALRRR